MDLGDAAVVAGVQDVAGGHAAGVPVTRSAQVQALCKAQGVPVLLHALPGRNDTVRLGLSALLAQHPEWKQYLTSRVVMTPHMGEMGRLTGKKVSETSTPSPLK